jgi:hypothetical protein
MDRDFDEKDILMDLDIAKKLLEDNGYNVFPPGKLNERLCRAEEKGKKEVYVRDKDCVNCKNIILEKITKLIND